MTTKILSSFTVLLLAGLLAGIPNNAAGARAPVENLSADPYRGAIVVDADTGQVLFVDHADDKVYPASVLKIMDLLVVLEKIKQGFIRLDNQITIPAEAAVIGGSQVFLKENETFSVDELLYALMVQSANDAAAALAIQAAGSKDAFVALMNQRAQELGMKATEFHSIHGLPPAKDQLPDVTTARDLARLARELLKYPDALRYTSCRERGFRNNTFIMRNHNHLLGSFAGCDGLKTGYFKNAGYSIAATAKRGDLRVIAVVLGSKSRKLRDSKTAELLTKGLALLAQKQAILQKIAQQQKAAEPPPLKEKPARHSRLFWPIAIALGGLVIIGGGGWLIFFSSRDKELLTRDR